MDSLFLLIPVSVILITIAILFLRWAVGNGQYDDLEKPAHSILFEEDRDMIPKDKPGKDTAPESVSSNEKTS